MTRDRYRIVHVATGHRPQDPRIHGRECRTLVAAGYDVVLVTPSPGPVDPADLDGVRVVPLPVPRHRAGRLLLTPFRAWRAARRQAADAFHIHDANLLPGAALLGARHRTVVYDAHEDVLLTVRDRAWLPSPLRRPVAALARLVERVAVRQCAAVVCAEPATAFRFPPAKTTVLANYPVVTGSAPVDPPSGRPPVGVYVGDLNRQRGARELVDAVGLVPPELDARLALAGRISGHGLMDELAARPGWSRVDFAGWLPPAAARDLVASARFGVVTFHATPSQMATQPVKLFEYLAAGLPVIVSDFPLWRELLGSPPAGLFVDPTDPTAIADAMTWVLRHPDEADEMGARGRRAVLERFRWDREAPRLLALYARLSGREAA
jgi:glycosyltransferase involved in cell wall biosynthesis